MAEIPRDRKQLRACMLCCLIKNVDQFKRSGCDNCEDILELRGNIDRVMEFIAMMGPGDSWVSRWQRIDGYAKGVYATAVHGRIPEYVEDELERRGIQYRPRDGSALE
ncbi:uncharacterized protein VTP21DRAFT_2924 [Calcarisporiella thermophila]|uniref:uncharacterized protein n=1 Tax=Calcarisporiella thermophila TaxID=911321 RepID=UPI00374240F7